MATAIIMSDATGYVYEPEDFTKEVRAFTLSN
jgi:hypothetical protein